MALRLATTDPPPLPSAQTYWPLAARRAMVDVQLSFWFMKFKPVALLLPRTRLCTGEVLAVQPLLTVSRTV
ncbi:Uncharacterised protein [uncultured archaeon]|nr:Uncharacterised protein [uncultured archaeon]